MLYFQWWNFRFCRAYTAYAT